jgi:hypothetical protein
MLKLALGIVGALVALVLPFAAQAEPATTQTVDVTGWNDLIPAPTADVHGTASLVRTDNGISMSFRTTGLPAGEPVTIWWIILESCEHGVAGLPCSAQFAAGHVVGNNGSAAFAGHLAEGDTSGCFLPNGLPADDLFPCEGLKDARSATVLLLARVHGPKRPGDVPTQIHTSETTGQGIANDLCGPVFCQVQAAIFPAP